MGAENESSGFCSLQLNQAPFQIPFFLVPALEVEEEEEEEESIPGIRNIVNSVLSTLIMFCYLWLLKENLLQPFIY